MRLLHIVAGLSALISGTVALYAVAMLMALTVLLAGVQFGFEALGSLTGKRFGIPAPVFLMFGTVALLGTLGDMRLMVGRRIEGPRRIARHLWRMCFALYIATASFFRVSHSCFRSHCAGPACWRSRCCWCCW